MTSRFCERCERITADGNLWCQDLDCPAESGYPVFSYGDYLGEMKIIKLISVWRAAALYEARRGKYTVWVKVAHRDDACENRLKREAQFLQSMTPAAPTGLAKFIKSFAAKKRLLWPQLLSPYNGPVKNPFGEITAGGALRVFMVMEPIEGSLLSDALLENPQVWHYEAAWVVLALARAMVNPIRHNLLHLGLVPQIVFVRVDDEGHWRPTLADFGWLLDASQAMIPAEMVQRAEPAYLAPEAQLQKAKPASDVWALGLIYYEMLEGRMGFENKLRRDEWVRRVVAQTPKSLEVHRPELAKAGVIQVLEKAISPGAGRYANIVDFARELEAIYHSPPPEKFRRPIRFYVLMGVLIALMSVAALFLLIGMARALG
jgi:serine/threonine protein kinase